jgi:hypothetical protein
LRKTLRPARGSLKLLRRQDENSRPRVASTCSAVAEIRDIDAARRYVRGDEVTQIAAPDAIHDPFPCALVQIAGDLTRIVPVIFQELGEVPDIALGIDENDGRIGVLHLEEPNENSVFLHRIHDVIPVLDLIDTDLPYAKREKSGFVQKLPCQRPNSWRDGGAEHVRLAFSRQKPLHFLHGRHEPHRQHFVGFVKNQHV